MMTRNFLSISAAFEEVKNERDNFKSATVVAGVGLGLAALILVFTILVLCIINKRRHVSSLKNYYYRLYIINNL